MRPVLLLNRMGRSSQDCPYGSYIIMGVLTVKVHWMARRSNQSILKEINPECSLEALMPKLQHFGHLMWKASQLIGKKPWCWERLRAGVEGSNREWDGWMTSPIQWTWVWANSGRWWRTGKCGVLQSMGSQSQIWLSDWTTTATLWVSYFLPTLHIRKWRSREFQKLQDRKWISHLSTWNEVPWVDIKCSQHIHHSWNFLNKFNNGCDHLK